ncbi:MAG: galactose-1-phosphate uridylyltransferase [Methermicoccaceae archaeon]
MSDIRQHYFLDGYSIVTELRGKRPTDFVKGCKERSEKSEKEDVLKNCFFCAGNEHMTPPATAVYTEDGRVLSDKDGIVKKWKVRVFPNRFPALSPDATPTDEMEAVDGGWKHMDGYGYHELIVESPRHVNGFALFTEGEMNLTMEVYAERMRYYLSQPHIKHVSLFKNCGRDAGASIYHTHTQLIAMPMDAPRISRETARMRNMKTCPLCKVVGDEVEERVLLENQYARVVLAYAPEFPFEMWVIPKEHVPSILSLSEEGLHYLGDALRRALFALYSGLDDPPYNCVFFQHPTSPDYHMSIRIFPRLSLHAGYEMGSDVFLCTVSPEHACEYLKKYL